MTFKESYTTDRLIAADTTATEAKKIKVGEESYLNAQMIEQLIEKIEKVRLSLTV